MVAPASMHYPEVWANPARTTDRHTSLYNML